MVAVVMVGCGGDGAPPADAPVSDTTVAPVELSMPAIPDAVRGRLVVQSAGPVNLAGTFRAQAGRCAVPSSLQIAVQDPLDGLLLLLILPDGQDSLATYPVVRGDSLPPAPAARAGVQRIVDSRPYSWRAGEGEVVVSGWTSAGVSGSFTLTVEETQGFERAMVAGAFRDLAVATLDSVTCTPSGPAPTR